MEYVYTQILSKVIYTSSVYISSWLVLYGVVLWIRNFKELRSCDEFYSTSYKDNDDATMRSINESETFKKEISQTF